MALSDFLSANRIVLDAGGCKRRDIISRLAERFAKDLGGHSVAYAEPLLAREKLGSTAIGKGVALPHGKAESLATPMAAVAVLRDPVNFPTPDGIDVDIVIAFLSPESPPRYLATIASIVKELRNDDVLSAFRSASTPSQVMSFLRRREGIQ